MTKAEVWTGFDFGRRRIGVAVAQTLTGQARALTTVTAVGERPDWQRITALIDEWRPTGLVVGLPLNADGSDHDVTRSARRFGNRLANDTRLPVHWIDERLSSHAAEERLLARGGRLRTRNRARNSACNPGIIDAEAASVILETWLTERPNSIPVSTQEAPL